jgi:transcriptional regulator with XRE-family HTH domain
MDSASDAITALGARVRAARVARGLSLAALARGSGVARATLTQLEAGQGNPTLETVYALANALAVPLSDLIGGPVPSDVQVVRAGEGPVLRGDVVEGRLVDRAELPGHVLELFDQRFHPGAEQVSGAHPPGVRERLLVTKGRIRCGPQSAPVELGPGDLAIYSADQPHVFAALSRGVAEAVMVTLSPRT